MIRVKKTCSKCKSDISLSNFDKHFDSCKGVKKEKVDINIYYINNEYTCPVCFRIFSKSGIKGHIWRAHSEAGKNFLPTIGKVAWNKGLTKDSDNRVRVNSENVSKAFKENPSLLEGRVQSEETKKKLSNVMTQRHKEGKAWNIGMSRWNNKPSYPESFFMKVIDNEFEDKNYIREYPVGKYSLDFAWVDKKLVIEIDGDQHERFDEYKSRDILKDSLLVSLGWKVLRIKWVDMHRESKKFIKIAKDFIHYVPLV